MKLFIAPAWLRAFLLFGGAALWLGIWHTGLSVASWILYIPAVMFVFAGVTGICPGVNLTRALLPPKEG
jgi:hypothetical protein